MLSKISAVALAGLLVLTACGDPKSWIGRTDTELMAKNGAPDRESRGSDGSKIMTYNVTNMYGRVFCTQTFTANSSGKIVRYSGC